MEFGKYLKQFQGKQAKKPQPYRDTSRIFDAKFDTEVAQSFFKEEEGVKK